VFFANAGDTAAISQFLTAQWGKSYPRHDAFGGGSAAGRFAAVLADTGFWTGSLQKTFHDHDA